ncbi:MAG: hypothetical protein GXY51_05560 [Bacteroidetes bacterium]|jgi:hypothetical protein|nr:hypothetical protein [Bacteroidota bacterium]
MQRVILILLLQIMGRDCLINICPGIIEVIYLKYVSNMFPVGFLKRIFRYEDYFMILMGEA